MCSGELINKCWVISASSNYPCSWQGERATLSFTSASVQEVQASSERSSSTRRRVAGGQQSKSRVPPRVRLGLSGKHNKWLNVLDLPLQSKGLFFFFFFSFYPSAKCLNISHIIQLNRNSGSRSLTAFMLINMCAHLGSLQPHAFWTLTSFINQNKYEVGGSEEITPRFG